MIMSKKSKDLKAVAFTNLLKAFSALALGFSFSSAIALSEGFENENEINRKNWNETQLKLTQIDNQLTTATCYGERSTDHEFRRFLVCLSLINHGLSKGKENTEVLFPLSQAANYPFQPTIHPVPKEEYGGIGVFTLEVQSDDSETNLEIKTVAQIRTESDNYYLRLKAHFFNMEDAPGDFSTLWQSLRSDLEIALLHNKVFGEISEAELVGDLINKSLSVIDPHSGIDSKKNIQNTLFSGRFKVGIGASIVKDKTSNLPSFSDVYPGSPAEDAGISPGDIIVMIGESSDEEKARSISKIPIEDLFETLNNRTDQTLYLWIQKSNDNSIHGPIQLTKRSTFNPPFYLKDLHSDSNEDPIGILGITSFLGASHFCSNPDQGQISPFGELIFALRTGRQDLIDSLLKRGYVKAGVNIDRPVKKLIIDVRGNRGGHLHDVHCSLTYLFNDDHNYLNAGRPQKKSDGSTSFFLDISLALSDFVDAPYETILTRRGSRRSSDFFKSIVVITDEHSASASEILAGTIKGGFGYVVGNTTFGKGLVQRVAPVEDFESMDPYLLIDLTEMQKEILSLTSTTRQFFLVAKDGSHWSNHLTGIRPDFLVPEPATGESPIKINEEYRYSRVYDSPFLVLPLPENPVRQKQIARIENCVKERNTSESLTDPAKTRSDDPILLALEVARCAF
jgi:C-terminal processing protease CtpA/Prc